MWLGRVVVAVLSVAFCVTTVGCGDDSEGDDDGSNGEEGVDWSTVNPPPNIDITSCYDITYDGDSDPEFGDECSACCMTAGYNISGSINDNHCTCGDPPDDDRDTVCAAEASQPTAAPCMTCCSAAGFSGSTWVGGGGAAGRCSCHGSRDSEICAAALDHPVPGEMCSYCCLENGYIGSGYVGFGEEECTCFAP